MISISQSIPTSVQNKLSSKAFWASACAGALTIGYLASNSSTSSTSSTFSNSSTLNNQTTSTALATIQDHTAFGDNLVKSWHTFFAYQAFSFSESINLGSNWANSTHPQHGFSDIKFVNLLGDFKILPKMPPEFDDAAPLQITFVAEKKSSPPELKESAASFLNQTKCTSAFSTSTISFINQTPSRGSLSNLEKVVPLTPLRAPSTTKDSICLSHLHYYSGAAFLSLSGYAAGAISLSLYLENRKRLLAIHKVKFPNTWAIKNYERN